MPLAHHLTNLPFELLTEVTRNVISKEDLCRLRSVDSLFETLATPQIFNSITVRNNKQSADRFWSFSHLASLHMFNPFHLSRVRCVNGMHLLRGRRWH
jgi:hypothetical protein